MCECVVLDTAVDWDWPNMLWRQCASACVDVCGCVSDFISRDTSPLCRILAILGKTQRRLVGLGARRLCVCDATVCVAVQIRSELQIAKSFLTAFSAGFLFKTSCLKTPIKQCKALKEPCPCVQLFSPKNGILEICGSLCACAVCEITHSPSQTEIRDFDVEPGAFRVDGQVQEEVG
jgi:hypothetical protein